MSKIGNYVLGRQENEYDNRYRNDFGNGSHMVLRDSDRGGEEAAHISEAYAVARAYKEYIAYCWAQHYLVRCSQIKRDMECFH